MACAIGTNSSYGHCLTRTPCSSWVSSFRGLLAELGTLTVNEMRMADSDATFMLQSEPTAVQQRCFELLGVTPKM